MIQRSKSEKIADEITILRSQLDESQITELNYVIKTFNYIKGIYRINKSPDFEEERLYPDRFAKAKQVLQEVIIPDFVEKGHNAKLFAIASIVEEDEVFTDHFLELYAPKSELEGSGSTHHTAALNGDNFILHYLLKNGLLKKNEINIYGETPVTLLIRQNPDFFRICDPDWFNQDDFPLTKDLLDLIFVNGINLAKELHRKKFADFDFHTIYHYYQGQEDGFLEEKLDTLSYLFSISNTYHDPSFYTAAHSDFIGYCINHSCNHLIRNGGTKQEVKAVITMINNAATAGIIDLTQLAIAKADLMKIFIGDGTLTTADLVEDNMMVLSARVKPVTAAVATQTREARSRFTVPEIFRTVSLASHFLSDDEEDGAAKEYAASLTSPIVEPREEATTDTPPLELGASATDSFRYDRSQHLTIPPFTTPVRTKTTSLVPPAGAPTAPKSSPIMSPTDPYATAGVGVVRSSSIAK